jgi:hypothetical protein
MSWVIIGIVWLIASALLSTALSGTIALIRYILLKLFNFDISGLLSGLIILIFNFFSAGFGSGQTISSHEFQQEIAEGEKSSRIPKGLLYFLWGMFYCFAILQFIGFILITT